MYYVVAVKGRQGSAIIGEVGRKCIEFMKESPSRDPFV